MGWIYSGGMRYRAPYGAYKLCMTATSGIYDHFNFDTRIKDICLATNWNNDDLNRHPPSGRRMRCSILREDSFPLLSKLQTVPSQPKE